MNTTIQSDALQHRRKWRLIVALVLFFGAVTFTHFASKSSPSWVVWTFAVIWLVSTFIWSWVALYQACNKKFRVRNVAVVPLTLFFSAFLATNDPVQAAPIAPSGGQLLVEQPSMQVETPQSVAPDFQLVTSPGFKSTYTLEVKPLNIEGYTVIGRIQSDGTVLSTNGTPLIDDNGNQVIVTTDQNGVQKIMARDKDGNVVQLAIGLCGALIIGGLILAGGIYAGYKIKCWAHKLLYPPTNAPPTNAPPTNTPPKKTVQKASLVGGMNGLTYIGELNENSVDLADVDAYRNPGMIPADWKDWQGNPIKYCVAGFVTNAVTSTGTTNYFQTSPNLVNWTPEPYSFMSWVSGTYDAFNRLVQSNTVTVVYDCYGMAFSTNWSTVTNGVWGTTNFTFLGEMSRVPIRPNVPKLFFRTAPLSSP